MVGPDCWDWSGYKDENGYGVLNVNDHPIRAHIVAYFLETGTIPRTGLVIDHICCNQSCSKYAHLEPVTQNENIRRYNKQHPKTHCPAGHVYNAKNLGSFTYKTGKTVGKRYRFCRTCSRNRARLRYTTRHSCSTVVAQVQQEVPVQ